MQSIDRRNIQASWDGHVLGLDGPGDCRLEIGLDGSRLVDVRTDAEGHALLELPYSPSGRAALSLQVTAIDQFVGAPSGQEYLAVTLVQRRVDVLDADGSVVSTDQRKNLDRYVAVIWTDGEWRLLGVEKAA